MNRCCKNFVYPPLFTYGDEKKIRLCNTCYKKSLTYLNQGSLFTNKGQTFNSLTDFQRFQEIENGLQILLTKRFYQLSDEILFYSLTKNQLNTDWYDILKSVVKETLEFVISNPSQESSMDINTFIKIKKIPYKDQSVTQVVQGVVIRKNVLHKKMNKDILNPTILMIKGNLDENMSEEISLSDAHSLAKGKDPLKSVVKKILKLNPDVIIVEGNVNRVAQEMLLEAGKTLVMKVKKKQFKRIERTILAKKIRNLGVLDPLDQSVLGGCKRFYLNNYQNKQNYKNMKYFKSEQIWESFDPTIMTFEASSCGEATVILSGPNLDQLVKVKSCLKEVFHALQIIFSEKCLIYQELFLYYSQPKLWDILSNGTDSIDLSDQQDIRQILSMENYSKENIREISRTSCLLNEISAATAGYIITYSTERYPIQTLVENKTFAFTKLVLVPIDVTSFPDLSSLNTNSITKLTNSLKESNRWHREELCQIEKGPQAVKVYAFSKGDMTLGAYLASKVARISEKCLDCNRSFYNHIFFFFTRQFYIKITMDLLDTQKLQQMRKDAQKAKIRPTNERGLERGNNVKNDSEGFFDYLAIVAPTSKKENRAHVESVSPNSHEFTSISNSPDIPVKKAKATADLLKDVKMYIECSDCKTILSETVKLKQNYLECSFIGYLESLTARAEKYLDYFILEEKRLKKQNISSKYLERIKDAPLKQGVKNCCIYSPKNRVFIIDDLAVRFRIGYSNPYKFCILRYKDAKAIEICQQSNLEIIKIKKTKLIELEKSYLWATMGSLKETLLYLLNKNSTGLTLEVILSSENFLTNSQAKDPYNNLLIELVPFYKEILELIQEIDLQATREAHNHFEIEVWKKSFFSKLMDLADCLEKKRSQFIKLLMDGKEAKKKEKDRDKEKEKEKGKVLDVINISGDQNSKSGQEGTSAEMEVDDMSFSRTVTVEDDPMMAELKMIQSQSQDNLIDMANSNEIEIDKEKAIIQQLIPQIFPYQEAQKVPLKYDFMPLDEKQPLSAIAYSINSPQYMKDIYTEEGKFLLNKELNLTGFIEYEFLDYSELIGGADPKIKKFIESKIFFKETENDDENHKVFNFKIPARDMEIKLLNRIASSLPGKNGEGLYVYKKKKTISYDLIEDFTKFIEQNKGIKKLNSVEKISFASMQVVIYYPAQFEALRMLNGIKMEDYLSSLSCSQNWADNTGGKTGASFIKTHDQRFVFKQIERKEFQMLLGFTKRYFNYMWQVCGLEHHSLLTKIYGIYEIYSEGSSKYYIAMENLFFGFEKNLKVYDLKGSELNRYTVKKSEEESGTLLDTNYKVDRNGEPLPIKSSSYQLVKKGIKNDSDFLASLKVVDYSLLLIVNEQTTCVRMGILDYLRIYDFEKHLEYMGKKIIKGTTPTIAEPFVYKERFQNAMKKYFMEVSD